MTNSALAQRYPFTLNSILTGLALNTPIWVDIAIGSSFDEGTASIRNVRISIVEI